MFFQLTNFRTNLLIKLLLLDERHGFKLTFKFADDNPFFTNKTLVKKYFIDLFPKSIEPCSSKLSKFLFIYIEEYSISFVV